MLVEKADYNLLRRDMIVALRINIVVKNSELVVKIFKLTPKDEEEINPRVWHSKGEIGKLDIKPIKIENEDPEDPIRIKQYPIPMGGRRGLKQVIDDLLKGVP